MSKIKSPQEKKRLSLELDRRNTYGNSPHAARKSIPRNKSIQHRQERHAASLLLSEAKGKIDDEQVVCNLENNIKAATKKKRLTGFKKQPDSPLGQVIELKSARRHKPVKS